MNRWLRFLILLAAALAATPLFAVQITDDRGVPIELRSRPVRIVTLSPHLAEIAFAAGAGSRLAAVARYSDYPDAVTRLPQIGDAAHVDVERILALKPDLILAWASGNPRADVERLDRLGFPVFVTEPRTLADIPRLVRLVGELAGTQAAAEAAAARLERELANLRARYGTAAPVRVFYEIWHRPVLTINGSHLISDVIRLCGGENVFATARLLTLSVSLEAIAAARPQVILGGSSAVRPQQFAAEWQDTRVAALRELPVRYVPPDLIQRQSPRIVQGARAVCEHLEEIRKR